MTSLPPPGFSSVQPPPRLQRRKDGVAEGVAGLRKEDLQSRHGVDWRPMFGVVSVKDTNGALLVDDRQDRHFGRQERTHSVDQLNVRSRPAHLAVMGLTALRNLKQDRRLIAR